MILGWRSRPLSNQPWLAGHRVGSRFVVSRSTERGVVPASAEVLRPVVHQPPPPLEQVRPGIGRLDRVADDVRQRRLDARTVSTAAATSP